MNNQKVVEIALCEIDKITLKIGQVYSFYSVKGCDSCQKKIEEGYFQEVLTNDPH